MQAFAIKKDGEFITKKRSKVPRLYATMGHARNAIAQLAGSDQSWAKHCCMDEQLTNRKELQQMNNTDRFNRVGEAIKFCKENVPSVEHFKSKYEVVEL